MMTAACKNPAQTILKSFVSGRA